MHGITDRLRATGGFSNVLLSIGGGGLIKNQHNIDPGHSVSDEDFMALYFRAYGANYGPSSTSLTSPILTSLGKLVEGIGASGIDVDMEALFFSYPDLAGGVSLLSEWALHQGVQLTWTPYEVQQFWESLRKSTSLPLSWANIQPPAWSGNPPALTSWAASFNLPVGSIVAGFDNTDGPISPAQIQQSLAECVKQGVNPGGAYPWTYDALYSPPTWSPKEMATAMTNGLAGKLPADDVS